MKRYQLKDSGFNGWFIGTFEKAIWKTESFEVSYQFCKKGEVSEKHKHKIAKELSLIAYGKVLANGQEFVTGELFEVDPGEELVCEYLEDTYTVCVKIPSVLNDKYYV
jgi:hypothetical protein